MYIYYVYIIHITYMIYVMYPIAHETYIYVLAGGRSRERPLNYSIFTIVRRKNLVYYTLHNNKIHT